MWRRIVIAAALSLGLLVVFLTLLITAPAFARPVVAPVRGWLVQAAAERLSQRLNGSLAVGALQGSLLSAPSLVDVVVRDPAGAVVARVDAIRLRYRPASLLGGRLVVHDVEMIRPDLVLTQAPDGTVNLSRLLPTASEPADAAGSWAPPVSVRIEHLRIKDGSSRLAFGFLKGVGAISDLQVSLAGYADHTGVHVTIQDVAAQTHPARVNLAGLRGSLHAAPGQFRIEQLQLRTENTRADVSLDLPGGPHPLRFSARLHPLDVTEIGRLLADDTLRGELRLELHASGPANDLSLDADVRAEAGQVTFQGRVDTAASPQRYRGTLTVHRLDLAALADREALKSDLNMVLEVDGKGLSAHTLEGRLNVSIQPSHVGDITLGRSQIRIAAQSQRLRVEAFELNSSLAVLTVGGSLDFQGTSDLTYEASARLSQLAPLLGGRALGGGLHLRGSATGAWPHLRAAGSLTAAQVQLDANHLQRLELDYEASQLGAAPQVSAQLRLRDMTIGESRPAAVHLQATYDGRRRRVTFAAQASQPPAMAGNVAGHVTLGDGDYHAVLDTVQLRLEEHTWRAHELVEATVKSGAFGINAFRLGNGQAAISLSGGIEKDAIRNVRLQASSIDLAPLQARLGLPDAVAGHVSLAVRASGTFAAPELQADLLLTPPDDGESPFDRLQATLQYGREKLSARISARHDDRDVMRARLEAPLDLAVADVPLPQRLLDAPLSLSVEILRPPLAALQAIVPTPALSGTLQGNVRLRGTFANLRLTSDIALHGLGVQNRIEGLDASMRLAAELETAASVANLGQALAAGKVMPRLPRLDLRVASASGRLPASAPGQSAPPVTVEDMHLQANAEWRPEGLQASIDRLQATAAGFGLPPVTLSASAQSTPSRLDLRQLRITTPKSRIEGQGWMTWADRKFDLQLQVPTLQCHRLRLFVAAVPFP